VRKKQAGGNHRDAQHRSLETANGHDLKDPLLSPVYRDLHGFPPAILTTNAPETKDAIGEIARFLDKHLGT
jgi:hypothetical protein